ncbi:MAG: hypothetical protein ACMUIS_00055 [bacterium]
MVTAQGSYHRLQPLLIVLAATLPGVGVFGVPIIILPPVFGVFFIIMDG